MIHSNVFQWTLTIVCEWREKKIIPFLFIKRGILKKKEKEIGPWMCFEKNIPSPIIFLFFFPTPSGTPLCKKVLYSHWHHFNDHLSHSKSPGFLGHGHYRDTREMTSDRAYKESPKLLRNVGLSYPPFHTITSEKNEMIQTPTISSSQINLAS
jgi:hypothetical protein